MLPQKMHPIAVAAALVAGGLALSTASADAYDAPAGYYDSITGTTPSTILPQLETRAKLGHNQTSYGEVRYALPNTDRDPNNPNNVLLVYNRISTTGQWQSGLYDSREHVWPRSRGVGDGSNTTRGSFGDIHNLKPSDSPTNSDRGSYSFGPTADTTGSNRRQGFYYYPGDTDAGDIARISFYMATRWEDQGLKLVNGTGNSANNEMGDLASLVGYHYRDVPDDFERRRNSVIYSDYTNNRNAYIDRPEYVWAAFVDNMNDSQLSIAATSMDGSSTLDTDFGKVLAGANLPTTSFTVSKSGQAGTYYSVTASGSVTSDVNGRYNAFEVGGAGQRTINVAIDPSATATPGAFDGSVTIDNLDVTTGYLFGHAGLDGDDVASFSGTAVAGSNASFVAGADVETTTLDLGIIGRGLGVAIDSVDVFNLDLAGLGDSLVAGLDLDSFQPATLPGFTLAIDPSAQDIAAGQSGSVSVNLLDSMLGMFAGSVTLMTSDADNVLGGRSMADALTLNLLGEVRIGGDANGDGSVDLSDFVVLRNNFGGDTGVDFTTGDFNRDGVVDLADFVILRNNFGGNAAPMDQWRSTVPEPMTLGLLPLAVLAMRRRR